MTAKEAIETLKANYPDVCYGQLREAVDAAIEALKAQDVAGDTIYRQAAIDTVQHAFDRETLLNSFVRKVAVDALKTMPSAHPEDKCGECDAWNQYKNYTRPDIVYCKDCICGHGEVWLGGNESADLYGYCGRTQLRVLPYDYCSYSKRRTDENN